VPLPRSVIRSGKGASRSSRSVQVTDGCDQCFIDIARSGIQPVLMAAGPRDAHPFNTGHAVHECLDMIFPAIAGNQRW